MANLFYGRINTNGAYVELSELIGTQIEEGTTYQLQPMDAIAMYVSDTDEIPTEGGFVIQNNPIVKFDLKAGEKMYIKTYNNKNVAINLAK